MWRESIPLTGPWGVGRVRGRVVAMPMAAEEPLVAAIVVGLLILGLIAGWLTTRHR
jgi:hypothetical protein